MATGPQKFHPKGSFKFPKRKFGKGSEERSFRAGCLKCPWLHYDTPRDMAFCYTCMSAAHENKFLTSTKREPALVSKGFLYWKDAIAKQTFNRHQVSSCHQEATEAMVSLPKQVIGGISEIITKEVKEQKAENRRMLITIIQNI